MQEKTNDLQIGLQKRTNNLQSNLQENKNALQETIKALSKQLDEKDTQIKNLQSEYEEMFSCLFKKIIRE